MAHIPGLPPLPPCFDGLVCVRTSSLNSLVDHDHQDEGASPSLVLNDKETCTFAEETPKITKNKGSDIDEQDVASPNFSETPNAKLNVALSRLKSEMAGLRKLDISLLYQLWSLHEAIQEYKNVVSDTGSEYSWGSLGSRANSVTSIDLCDFNDDFQFQSDPSLQGSTTSIIQQIEELKVRAESENLFL